MPTSYQTSASPRGGRRKDDPENKTSGKASHESLQKVYKKASKSSERNAPAMSDRPTSPASFVSSSSLSTDRSVLPKHSGLYTPSTMSLNSQRSLPYLDDGVPLTVPPSRQSPEVRPVRPINRSTPAIHQTPKPGAASETANPILPSPVTDLSSRGPPPAQPSPAEGPRVLQHSVEEVYDGEMLTPTAANPPSQQKISSHVFGSQTIPKSVTEEEDSKDGLEKVTSKTSLPPPATPVMSPPISPRINYIAPAPAPVDYGPNMNPTRSHYSYTYPPNMAMMSASGSFYPGQYYNTPYSPPMEQRQAYDVGSGAQLPRSGSEDHREHLLQKVSDVLPDLHRLLNAYKETQGQLSAKEILVQQSEREHEEKLSRLKIELDANKKEYEKVIQSLVGDRGKLEREATGLREQVANLQTLAEEHGKMQVQVVSLQSSLRDLEASVETLQRTKEELLLDKEVREKELQTSRDAHSCHITEIQKLHEESLAVKEKEYQQTLSEQKNMLSKTQLDLAGLISKHANLKSDLEVCRSLQNEHKIRMDDKINELDATRARHAEEIKAVKRAQEEDRGKTLNELEAQNTKVVEDHNRKEQKWTQDLETLQIEMQTHEMDLEKERKEHEILKATRKREQDQASELARGIASWKAKHIELQAEHEKVDKLFESFRPIAEARPKGDNFFIEAFQQLASSIAALSIDHFYNPPPALPKDVLRLIPPDMPDFTQQTEAARQLRAFYVQHKVFKVLTIRIFQPFLFTSDCRCGGADVLLQNLSNGIRSKSERRESAWRQITLRTAYGGSQAKKAINLVGHKTVEEIFSEIKWFTDEDEWSSLTSSIQLVVKMAAQLWRCAKLEREHVTVLMSGEDEHHEINRRSSQAGVQVQRIVVLGVTPHVARDAVHKEYQLSEERSEAGPLTFLQGLALYNDSEVVVTRRQEEMAG